MIPNHLNDDLKGQILIKKLDMAWESCSQRLKDRPLIF
jgi:hypothetical protein